MNTLEVIAQVLAESLKLLDEHINDPARRLSARVQIKNKCIQLAKEIVSEQSPEKADKLLLDFLNTINNL